jgi:hypothetical protein
MWGVWVFWIVNNVRSSKAIVTSSRCEKPKMYGHSVGFRERKASVVTAGL